MSEYNESVVLIESLLWQFPLLIITTVSVEEVLSFHLQQIKMGADKKQRDA